MTDLERCDREIAACRAELERGDPDIGGALLGLTAWMAERRLIEAEARG